MRGGVDIPIVDYPLRRKKSPLPDAFGLTKVTFGSARSQVSRTDQRVRSLWCKLVCRHFLEGGNPLFSQQKTRIVYEVELDQQVDRAFRPRRAQLVETHLKSGIRGNNKSGS